MEVDGQAVDVAGHVGRVLPGEGAEVAAAAEDPPVRLDHDGPHRRVVGQGEGDGPQLGGHLGVDGVAGVGAVEGEHGDGVGMHLQRQGAEGGAGATRRTLARPAAGAGRYGPAVHASSSSIDHELMTRSIGTPRSAARSQPWGCHSSWPVAWASVSIEK